MAEADRHRLNLFACLVGVTAKGCKGTSWGHVRRIFEATDPEWVKEDIASGLSSGEGNRKHTLCNHPKCLGYGRTTKPDEELSRRGEWSAYFHHWTRAETQVMRFAITITELGVSEVITCRC